MKTRIRPRLEALEARALLNAGDLDLTFGGTGKVTTQVGVQGSGAQAVAVQTDLKVVAAGISTGTSRHGSFTQLSLVRYNADGSLDPSFGSGGIATTATPEMLVPLMAMALQGDGKILVVIDAGVTQKGSKTTNEVWELFRFDVNGTLDTSFGGGTGKVITDFTPGNGDHPYGIAVQGDGKIVVVGTAGSLGFAVARYTAGGTLDTTFGTGGEVTTHIRPSAGDVAQAVAIDSAGRIIVAGHSEQSGMPPEMAMARYTPSGALDTSFGIGGIQTALAPGFTGASTYGLGLQSSGKIVVLLSVSGPSSQLALARFNTDGSLDQSFGSAGFYVESRMDPGNGLGEGGELAIQPDDKIVAMSQGNSSDFWVTRVLADGSAYDPAYGSAGLGRANLGGYSATPLALALDSNGRAVVAGQYWIDSSHSYFAVARFQGDTTIVGSLTTLTAPAFIASPTQAPSLLDTTLVALALDSPDLWDVIRPPAKRRGSH